MALKFFDGVMNFLGLVDADSGNAKNKNNNNPEDDFDRIDRTRGAKTPKGGNRRRPEDEFDDEPRVAYVPRRGGSANPSGRRSPQNAPQDNDFDADDIWGDGSARPAYGVRNGTGAPNGQRGGSARYGGGQSGKTTAYDYQSAYQGAGQSDYRTGSSKRGYSQTNYYGGENTMNNGNDQYGNNQGGQKHQMAMFRIKTVDECKNVIRTLLEKKSVLLSLEEMDSVQAQRVVDTMSGATFAIGAKMNRASARSWLLTPNTVEVDDKHAIGSNTIL